MKSAASVSSFNTHPNHLETDPRSSVWHAGARLASLVHRGGEGERATHGGEGGANGRGLREAEELAEGGLPQADDRRLQRDQRGRRWFPQGPEALGQKAQGGLFQSLQFFLPATFGEVCM